MKATYYDDLLRGKCEDLPEIRSKVVRVFLSSTFSGNSPKKTMDHCSSIMFIKISLDTLAERDSLIENVFPKLKEYCRLNYGLEFQVEFLSSQS